MELINAKFEFIIIKQIMPLPEPQYTHHFHFLSFQLPIETEIVDLSGNSIKLLPNKTFSPILKTIDLSGNGLVRLELNAFADLRELTKLDLSSNNLDSKFSMRLSDEWVMIDTQC